MKTTNLEVLHERLSDEEIISRILAGRKNDFEILMRRYNPRMYRVGMSIVGDEHEVEDLMQNAYIKAWHHLESFGYRSLFSTWLTRIMINECLQHLRRQKLKEKALETKYGQMQQSDSDFRTPATVVMNRELGRALEQALLRLPEKYRLTFVLREMESLSVAETMDVLGISESNVKVRLSRAREMLRDHLSQHYKGDLVFGFHLVRCNRVVEAVWRRLDTGNDNH